MKFSERRDLTPVPRLLQRDNMTVELRNSLWNVLDLFIWQTDSFIWSQYGAPGIDGELYS